MDSLFIQVMPPANAEHTEVHYYDIRNYALKGGFQCFDSVTKKIKQFEKGLVIPHMRYYPNKSLVTFLDRNLDIYVEFELKSVERIYPVNKKGLGDDQYIALESLIRHGGYPGSGWVMTNRSRTERLLESLVKRQLATKTKAPRGYYLYAIAPAGREAVAEKDQAEKLKHRQDTSVLPAKEA